MSKIRSYTVLAKATLARNPCGYNINARDEIATVKFRALADKIAADCAARGESNIVIRENRRAA